MALDYAKTPDERAAIALIAGPGARLTGRFGGRGQVEGVGETSSFHRGLDVAGRVVGDRVLLYTPRSFATVWYSGKDANGALDLFLGSKADGLRFVHNSEHLHTKGRVAAGTAVARMGMTGKANGVHVHLERYENGQPVDPLPWLIGLLRSNGTPASSGGSKVDAPASPTRLLGEDNDMPIIAKQRTTGHVFALATGHIRHETDQKRAEYNARVFTVEDRIVEMDDIEFLGVIDSLGIPRSAPARLAKERGTSWSAVKGFHDARQW